MSELSKIEIKNALETVSKYFELNSDEIEKVASTNEKLANALQIYKDNIGKAIKFYE